MAVKRGCEMKVARNEVRIIIGKKKKKPKGGVENNMSRGEGVFSRGSQEGLMARPQSRLDVCCSL